MQNYQGVSNIQTIKLLLLSSLLVTLSPQSGAAEIPDSNDALSYADSLFNQGKYTESFQVYEIILEGQQYSPGMLLRMAYIKEGLGDYSNALYYLNLYYNKSSNKRVFAKMQEIAEEHQLSGYDYSDVDFLYNIFQRFRFQVQLVLISSSVLILFLIFSKKGNKFLLAGFNALILAALFYTSNFSFVGGQGIITGQNNYLMSGPSSGAEVVEIIGRGHRVEVVEIKGIWTKILWGNQEAFIRNNKIKRLG
ncbi:MAG: hypothetical protein RJQ09_19675 [Cyclobacteriaceae bacterium]